LGTMTRDDLGMRLQTIRGAIWQEALVGDRYAEVLRDFADLSGTGAQDGPGAPPDCAPPVTRSVLGAWLVRDAAVAREVLTDERFGFRRPDGHKAHLQIMPVTRSRLGVERVELRRMTGAARPLLGDEALRAHRPAIRGHAERLLRGIGAGPFDLVGDFARPLGRFALSEVLGLPGGVRQTLDEHWDGLGLVPDGMATPQRLADALALSKAVKAVETALTGHNGDEDVAFSMVASVLYSATVSTAVARTATEAGPLDEVLRRHPPMRLLARAAHTDVDLAGSRVRSGDQVVVLVAEAERQGPVLAEDPQYSLVLPLVRLTARVAADTILAEGTISPVGKPLRRLRSPVTAALLRCPVAFR